MMETPTKGSEKLTLDDLFALKRAEMPQTDFWEQFDQELRRKSLCAFTNSMRQQRHSLWRGWGIGVCMASMLALALPVLLLLESHAPQDTTVAYWNGETIPHEHILPPWEELQITTASFVLDTLEATTSSVENPALHLTSPPTGHFVMDTLTLEVPSARNARSSAIF